MFFSSNVTNKLFYCSTEWFIIFLRNEAKKGSYMRNAFLDLFNWLNLALRFHKD